MALPPISRTPTPAAPIAPIANPRAAAQRAFFDAALKRAQAPAAAPAPATAATTAVRAQQPLVQISDTPPTRPLRPGSMVDILV